MGGSRRQRLAGPTSTPLARLLSQVQVGGSPLYIVDKKLGKGGFGQVYLGRRAQPTKDKDGPNSNVVRALCRRDGRAAGLRGCDRRF